MNTQEKLDCIHSLFELIMEHTDHLETDDYLAIDYSYLVGAIVDPTDKGFVFFEEDRPLLKLLLEYAPRQLWDNLSPFIKVQDKALCHLPYYYGKK